MLETAMIFGNGMVLQRQKPIFVWGEAEPGAEIAVTLGDTASKADAGEDGHWRVALPAMEAASGLSMSVSDGMDEIRYNDICVGEVWIAGGQSNMEYLLAFDEEGGAVAETERNPLIRFFDYPEVSYEGELEDFNYEEYGFWRGCTKKDLPYFTAVGYYFAKNVQESLGIPVGIVGCNWGGTTACSWMDPALLSDNEGEVWLENYEKAVAGMDLESYKAAFKANPMNDRTKQLTDPFNIQLVKVGLTREQQLQLMGQMEQAAGNAAMLPMIGPYYERRPGGLYETMLKKIVPYGVRGVIWYQGESDEEHAEEYGTVFGNLIKNWRELWKEELPFLFVQLAPFGEWMACSGERFPIVRKKQELISKTVSNTWMASASDCGMEWDIHPKRKRPVGERLALLARGHIYGQNLLCDAPEIQEAVLLGEDIVLSFSGGDGLRIEGDTINGLKLYDGEGKEIQAKQAVIQDGQIRLGGCAEAEQVCLGQTGYYKINLYNMADIPAKPFVIQVKR